MATTSQKMILASRRWKDDQQKTRFRNEVFRQTYEIRFFVRIRGARTPPPRMDEPVMKIPLTSVEGGDDRVSDPASLAQAVAEPHHPAPRTESPMQRPTPMSAQK